MEFPQDVPSLCCEWLSATMERGGWRSRHSGLRGKMGLSPRIIESGSRVDRESRGNIDSDSQCHMSHLFREGEGLAQCVEVLDPQA